MRDRALDFEATGACLTLKVQGAAAEHLAPRQPA